MYLCYCHCIDCAAHVSKLYCCYWFVYIDLCACVKLKSVNSKLVSLPMNKKTLYRSCPKNTAEYLIAQLR